MAVDKVSSTTFRPALRRASNIDFRRPRGSEPQFLTDGTSATILDEIAERQKELEREQSFTMYLTNYGRTLLSHDLTQLVTLKGFHARGGKFIDGRAYLPTGEGYTGVIALPSGNNDRIAMGFKEGFLTYAIKKNAAGEDIYTKEYSYDEEGKIKKVVTDFGDRVKELEKVPNGHTIKENGKLEKSFRKDSKNDVLRVSYYDEEGKLDAIKSTGARADYPLKKYLYNAEGKVKQIDSYDETGRLCKRVEYYPHGASKTFLSPGQKNEKIIKETKVKEDGALPYEADKSVRNGLEYDACTIAYVKDGAEIITEKYTPVQPTETVRGDYAFSHIRKDAGSYYRGLIIEDHRTGKNRYEVVYETGARDVLLSGNYNSSDMEVQFLNPDGDVSGYFKRMFLKEDSRSINDKTETISYKVREQYLDGDRNVTSSRDTYRSFNYLKES